MSEAETVHDRIRRLSAERERIGREEAIVRSEAEQELERIVSEIEKLEERREILESFLNINHPRQRLEHGRIRDLCFDILQKHPAGLTSGHIRDIIARENPGIRLGSVPASLSYQTAQGRLKRDDRGRYMLAQ